MSNDDWRTAFGFRGRQVDMYNTLVHGFRKGHLYMDQEPDPALWSTDPVIRRRASYVQDASLYNHRYYVYYGVVPAVLILLPYSVLTGGDLSQNAATLICALVGFLCLYRTYRRAQTRYFENVGPWVDAVCVLLLGFATLAPVLVKCSGVYELAVASGFACSAAGIYFLYRSLESPKARLARLAAASLMLGLAVGCRPDYVLTLPVLAAAAFLIRRVDPSKEPERPSFQSCAAAAVLPALVVGLLLAVYNYERFGNPMEFGFNYGMNAFTGSGRPVTSLSFMGPNLRWYYLTPPVVIPYFPYFVSINASVLPKGYFSPESIHGQWVVAFLALIVGVGVANATLRGRPARGLGLFSALPAWMAASTFVFMISLAVRADRYMTDFQAPLVLLIVLYGGWAAGGLSGISSRVWRAAFCAVAGLAIVFNLLISLEIFHNFEYLHPESYRRLASLGDIPAHELSKRGFLEYGPLRFTVVFPEVSKQTLGPLLAMGVPNRMDILYVSQQPSGTMELSLSHEGYVSLRSPLLQVAPGRPHTFEVDMGSLYPPRFSPYFDDMDAADVEWLKTTGRILLDGKEVVAGRLAFYDAPPGRIYFGQNPEEDGSRLAAKVSDVHRLPPRDLHAPGALSEPGIWRADIVVPWLAPDAWHPLLGSGVTGRGNLLVVSIPNPGKVRFGFDQWGSGMTQSPVVDFVPGVHRLEIFVGPQVARQRFPAAWQIDAGALKASSSLMRLWWDGVPVWTAPIVVNKDSYGLVSLGSNPQGFSTADMVFPSAIEFKPYSLAEMKDFIARNLREAK